MAWFRLHTNILNSRKIKTLPDKIFRAWIESMAIARDHGGELPILADYAYEFAIGVESEVSDGGITLVGVSIVGNPLSATYMDGFTAEVLRLCTSPEAPKNTCSMLYAACWRAWRAMGGRKLITYTLQSESGISLRAAGWKIIGQTKPIGSGWGKKDHLVREWKPIYGQAKLRWEVEA